MKQIFASMALGLASLSWPPQTEAGADFETGRLRSCNPIAQVQNVGACSCVSLGLSSAKDDLNHLGRAAQVVVILDEEATRPTGPLSAASQFSSLRCRTSIETINKFSDRVCPFAFADPDNFISSIELGGKPSMSDIDPDSGLAVAATYYPEPLRLLLSLIELACVGTELVQRLRGKVG